MGTQLPDGKGHSSPHTFAVYGPLASLRPYKPRPMSVVSPVYNYALTIKEVKRYVLVLQLFTQELSSC